MITNPKLGIFTKEKPNNKKTFFHHSKIFIQDTKKNHQTKN